MGKSGLLAILMLMAVVISGCGVEVSYDGVTEEPTPEEGTLEPIDPAVMAEPSDLAGSSWVLREIHTMTGVEQMEFTLNFDENTLGGAACNSYGATYTAVAGSITITDVFYTEMACMEPEGIMMHESIYYQMLAMVTTYEVSGDELVMGTPQEPRLLVFGRAADNPSVDALAGSAWVLTEMNGQVVGIIPPVTLTFDNGSGFSGTACNRYNSVYRLGEDNRIAVEPIQSTKILCAQPEGMLDIEAAYHAALQSATSFTVSADRLELHGADGSLVFAADNDGTVSTANLAGTKWVLWSMDGSGVPDDVQITLEFDDTTPSITGFSGCGSYEGRYEVGQFGQIAITELTETDTVCMGIMGQETRFLELLRQVNGFSFFEVNFLQLHQPEGPAVVLTRVN